VPDPDQNNEQQSLPSDSSEQSLPLDPELSEELDELAKKLDATENDVPAIPSNLHTHEEVAFQIELERLRIWREKRMVFTSTRRSFVFLIGLMALIALVATAAMIVGLSRGEKEIVVPALASLSGAGATGALLCRAYVNRLDSGSDDGGSS
jgi:hypothetical protein